MSGIQNHPNRGRMCVPLIRCIASLDLIAIYRGCSSHH
jgi:hypothetical protein